MTTASAVRRVVVTGVGCVTPLGCNVGTTWTHLCAGRSGVALLEDTAGDYANAKIPPQYAARVPATFDRDKAAGPTRRALPDNILFALEAAREAMHDAGLSLESRGHGAYDSVRAGVCVGTGISGMSDLLGAHDTLRTRGYRRISPFLIPNSLVNMTAGLLSIEHQLKGPNHSVSTACATGAHGIGDAFRFIKYGDADVMVCGATDACIAPVVVAGFARAKALAPWIDGSDAQQASRPFDEDRRGFVIAEGAAILILEELEHAVERGARIYCEIKGYGTSGDAHHITAPHSSGEGALRAMQNALREGNVRPDALSHVNAHATSTPLGDEIECRAIEQLVTGEGNTKSSDPAAAFKTLSVTSTKGATGHLLGAAGALEALFTVLSVHSGVVPPTINLSTPIPTPFCIVANHPQEQQIAHALSNSFGFGGTNASLLFSTYHS